MPQPKFSEGDPFILNYPEPERQQYNGKVLVVRRVERDSSWRCRQTGERVRGTFYRVKGTLPHNASGCVEQDMLTIEEWENLQNDW